MNVLTALLQNIQSFWFSKEKEIMQTRVQLEQNVYTPDNIIAHRTVNID